MHVIRPLVVFFSLSVVSGRAVGDTAALPVDVSAAYRLSAVYTDNGLEQIDGLDDPRAATDWRADTLKLYADGNIPGHAAWAWHLGVNALAQEQADVCDEQFKDDLWTRHRCRPSLVEEGFLAGPNDAVARLAVGRKTVNQGGFAARGAEDVPELDSFYLTYHAPFRAQEVVVEAQLHAAGIWSLQLFDDVVTTIESGGQISPKSMQPAGTLQWELLPLQKGADGINPLVQVMLYDLTHSRAVAAGVAWQWGPASGWINVIRDRRVQRLGNDLHWKALDEVSSQVTYLLPWNVALGWRHVQLNVGQPDAPSQYSSDRNANITRYFDDHGRLDTLSLEWRVSPELNPGVGLTERSGKFVQPDGTDDQKRERSVVLSLRGTI